MIDLPRSRQIVLCERAGVLLGSRRPGTELKLLARDMIMAVHDVCTRAGRDDILAAFVTAYPEIDVSDRQSFAEYEPVLTAAIKRLGAIDIDGGGPRNAKPTQVVDSVLGALDVNLVDEADRSIELDGALRSKVDAALSALITPVLSPPGIRDTVIAEAKALVDASHHPLYAKITAQLDERGMKLERTPKVPIDSLHAVQRAVARAREAIIARTSNTAIDRFRDIIASANPEAAARIDQPITVKSTPREVGLLRLTEPRSDKTPAWIIHTLVEGISELAGIRWRAVEQAATPYAASKTFVVGDVIEHPKFGRGAVTIVDNQRISVEFPEGTKALIHVPPRR